MSLSNRTTSAGCSSFEEQSQLDTKTKADANMATAQQKLTQNETYGRLNVAPVRFADFAGGNCGGLPSDAGIFPGRKTEHCVESIVSIDTDRVLVMTWINAIFLIETFKHISIPECENYEDGYRSPTCSGHRVIGFTLQKSAQTGLFVDKSA